MLFETRLQSAQDLHGLLDGRLVDINLLEATGKRVVFLEHAAEFVKRRRADALQLARRQRRLEQVGSVERATRSRTRTNDRVNLIDEQNTVWIRFHLLEHCFQALLEVAAVFGTGQ